MVYRHTVIPQLENLVLFGDTPSGEIFYIQADQLPGGGQNTIRRVLLDDGGEPKTLLQLVQAKNIEQGKPPAQRADVRFGTGPETQIFVLNKHDGTIRVLVPKESLDPDQIPLVLYDIQQLDLEPTYEACGSHDSIHERLLAAKPVRVDDP